MNQKTYKGGNTDHDQSHLIYMKAYIGMEITHRNPGPDLFMEIGVATVGHPDCKYHQGRQEGHGCGHATYLPWRKMLPKNAIQQRPQQRKTRD